MNDKRIAVTHVNIRLSISLLLFKLVAIELFAAAIFLFWQMGIYTFIRDLQTFHSIIGLGMPLFVLLVVLKTFITVFVILQWLNEYYEIACNFFQLLELQIPELREYFRSKDYSKIVKKYRGNFGGSLIFRPIGLTLILEIVERLVGKYGLEHSILLIAKLPRNLSQIPYADVIWNTKSKTIVNKHRVLTRNLLLYMLGEQKASEKLLRGYADAIGKDITEVSLPAQLKA